jgi:hypothetical protein
MEGGSIESHKQMVTPKDLMISDRENSGNIAQKHPTNHANPWCCISMKLKGCEHKLNILHDANNEYSSQGYVQDFRSLVTST